MRKTLLILAAAATVLAACTKDPQEAPVLAEGAIGFDAYTTTSAATKGSVQATSEITGGSSKGIGVFAFYQPKATGDFNTYKYTTPDFMYNQQVTTADGGSSWSYSPTKYWPNNEGDKLSFFAYAPYDEAKTWEDMGIKTDVNASKMTVSFPINGKAADQKDYLWADPQLNLTKPSVKDKVSFAFSHVTSQVNLYVGVETDMVSRTPGAWTYEDTEIEIKSIELKDLSTSLNYTYDLAKRNSLTKAASTEIQNVVLTTSDFVKEARLINNTNYNTAGWKQLNDSKSTMFLAPGESLSTAVVTYTVTTKDAKLNGSKSVITNTVTCDLSGISALEAQKVYNLQFLIGMTSVKVSATVADWPATTSDDDYQINMPEVNTNHLTFTFTSKDQTLKLASGNNMEISQDGKTWSTWENPTAGYTVGDGLKLYVRGKSGSATVAGFSGNFTKVEGNVMSLVDYTYANASLNKDQFYDESSEFGLFTNCTSLVDASGLVLPATTLASECYRSMFKGCTSLTSAPALSATTLAFYCYESMFEGCTSLTSAPALPATELVSYCYESMFSGCTALTGTVTIKAQTQPSSKLTKDMFVGSGTNGGGEIRVAANKNYWNSSNAGISSSWTVVLSE